MKTVLLAAAGCLFLAFAAHAAEALQHGVAPASSGPASEAPSARHVAPARASGVACIDGAAVTPTAYSPDADAESGTSPCSQYLSTQTLVQSPGTGRT